MVRLPLAYDAIDGSVNENGTQPMRIDRSFDWLGRFPLAVDIADTVRLVQDEEVELLTDEDALARWVEAELPRFPYARVARGRLRMVRELRDAVRGVLVAHASGHPLPRHHVELLNEASASCPGYPAMGADGERMIVELSDEPFDIFRAQVARSTFEVLGGEPTVVSVCQAPSCGMLFVPRNPRQRWCSSQCGNRARVARHAVRATRANFSR